MAPPDSDSKATTKQRTFTDFLYFLVPRTLLEKEREKRVLGPNARKRKEARQNLIYPFRAKATPTHKAEEAKATPEDDKEKDEEETPVAETATVTPGNERKKGKRVRFAVDEPLAAADNDEGKGKSPEEDGKEGSDKE